MAEQPSPHVHGVCGPRIPNSCPLTISLSLHRVATSRPQFLRLVAAIISEPPTREQRGPGLCVTSLHENLVHPSLSKWSPAPCSPQARRLTQKPDKRINDFSPHCKPQPRKKKTKNMIYKSRCAVFSQGIFPPLTDFQEKKEVISRDRGKTMLK